MARSNGATRWVGSVSGSNITETLTRRYPMDEDSSFHEKISGFLFSVRKESKIAAMSFDPEDEDTDIISPSMAANDPMAW
jgi:hypothetical protein